MKKTQRAQGRLQVAARLFSVAALLNVLACLLYALLHHWLFVVVWGALAGVNVLLAVVFGTLAKKRRLL